MEYAILLRRLSIDGVIYYQAFEKVKVEKDLDDRVNVVSDSKTNGKNIGPIHNLEELGYVLINQDDFYNIDIDYTTFIKFNGESIEYIKDSNEIAKVIIKFKNKYNDFSIFSDLDLEEIIRNTRSDLKSKLIGQDAPIKTILDKLYHNQMLIDADIQLNEIRKQKSNILLIGPFGVGKSTIKDSIIRNFEPLPVVELKLTGDYSADFTSIINQLLIKSNGNQYLAERGIVILDDINYYDILSGNQKIDSLEAIINQKEVYGIDNSRVTSSFDLSMITFVCIADIDYDYEDECVYNDAFISKIDGTKLLQMGFTDKLLRDSFQDEVIYMNEMTPKLAFKILTDKKISPLYKIKFALENRGKKVIISKNFIENLINFGLEFNQGITGIIKAIDMVLEKKNIVDNKVIRFSDTDFENLMISSAIPEPSELSLEKSNSNNTKKNNHKGILDINLEKRTINGHTVMDTVNIMKKTIIGQDEQIFSLVNAFFKFQFSLEKGYSPQILRDLKENILLIGPSGSGKTTMVKMLSEIFNLPFLETDITQYSKAGYVGEDINSMFVDLVNIADGNVEKAQYGILYIDEFDKIATTSDSREGSMAKGVENSLLKVLDGHKRTITMSTMDKTDTLEFDTSYLFIVASGAYEKIDEITKRRKGFAKLGFMDQKGSQNYRDLIPNNDDLYEYGHSMQILGRLHHKIYLSSLSIDSIMEIINNPYGGYISSNLKLYKDSGVTIKLSDGFKQKFAKMVIDKKTGARGIKDVFSDVLSHVDWIIKDGDVSEVILDENSIDEPNAIQYIKRKKILPTNKTTKKKS